MSCSCACIVKLMRYEQGAPWGYHKDTPSLTVFQKTIKCNKAVLMTKTLIDDHSNFIECQNGGYMVCPYVCTYRIPSNRSPSPIENPISYGRLGWPPKFHPSFWDLNIESMKLYLWPLLWMRWRRSLSYPKQSTSLPKRRVISEIPKRRLKLRWPS